MSIKLKGSSDGSVSLTAPADTSPSGSDKTLTLPTTTGSANQFVKNGSTAGSLEFSSMVEDSSGRLGIGTTSPGAELEIKKTSTPVIRLNQNDTFYAPIKLAGNDLEIRGSSGQIEFYTGNNDGDSSTERLVIGSAGHLYSTSNSNSLTQLTLRKGSAADGVDFMQCRDSSNSEKFTIKSNGNAENANGTFVQISDVKLKENIVDASSQWDDIKAIRIRNWNFKEETGYETHTQIGVIAQELETVCPALVTENPDRDDEGNDLGTVTKSIKQSILYMKAVKALQEAQIRIETLETQNTAQQAQIDDLLARVTALEAAE